jgi:hypothetical protein
MYQGEGEGRHKVTIKTLYIGMKDSSGGMIQRRLGLSKQESNP